VLKGIMKLVLDAHAEALRNGAAPVLDVSFIERHTHGFETFADDLRRTSWEDILQASGLPRDQLERIAGCSIIWESRGSSAHLHWPWRATVFNG
jgi:anaerobic selenocysteine-containing dehydrogenase